MDFGQTLDPQKLDQIRWSLPALDSPEERVQLERLTRASSRSLQPCRIAIGAPIWNHAPWVGSLYPPGTSATNYLKEYSRQFSTVEVNSTFYALSSADQFQKWKDAVSEDFRFCPKFPKTVSHSLSPDHPDLQIFAERVAILQDRLGVCFLQFPSQVGPDQQARLRTLFARLPRHLKTVVEFRHPAFFHEQRLKPEWVDELARFHLGTVSVDTPLERAVAHTSLSSTRVLIRYLGANLHSSNEIRFQQWAERIATWVQHGIKEVYFVVHEPDNTHATVAAKSFIEKLKPLVSVQLQEPVFHCFF